MTGQEAKGLGELPEAQTVLLDRIDEVLNLPDNKGTGLALTGKGYCLLYRIRTDLAAMFRACAASVGEGMVVVPREPTEEMLEAGRAAVMARDCSGKDWSPRQHYEASGISTEGIPDDYLAGYHSIIPKAQGAALVYAAMLAASPAARGPEGGE